MTRLHAVPKQWPFPSSDPRFAPEPTPQPQHVDERVCECREELSEQELDEGRCLSCGGKVLP